MPEQINYHATDRAAAAVHRSTIHVAAQQQTAQAEERGWVLRLFAGEDSREANAAATHAAQRTMINVPARSQQ